MASTINGTSTGNGGLISTGDDSGILNIQTNETTAITVDATQIVSYTNNLGTVAGYPAYQCRAWVNFDGTTSSPCTIRASANVTSVTKNTTGVYTLNFTNAMPDANYSVAGMVQYDQSGNQATHNLMAAEITNSSNAMQTGSVSVSGKYGFVSTTYDMTTFCVAIFR
jgi:hypothetical protein